MMNIDIEKLLRKPPAFTPPAGLRERLIEQIPARAAKTISRESTIRPASGSWLRRWWPALAPAAVSVACAVVLTAQQGKIRELRANIQTLSQAPMSESGSTRPDNGMAAANNTSAETEAEINRLKELAARLKAEIAQLQGLQTENAKLRAQVAAPPELGLTPEESESLAKAKERAQSIACVNNLKQFGLAVRVWALDNNDSNPPNILCMSNELSTPKILVCPADTARPIATDFSSFTVANCSYDFLAPAEITDKEPQRVLSRCPIHGHIGLCDGSVQSFIAKNHPEQLDERDNGKWYLRPASPPAQANTAPTGMSDEQAEIFGKRYGLLPQNVTVPNNTTTAITNPTGEQFTITLKNPTPEQLRILKERYGIVVTNGTPNQNP